jgi:ABC-type Mn2+/Zn2+ transport system ATPase subunit
MATQPAIGGGSGIQVEGLGVRFGTNQVLKDLSFTVPKGGALAVIGPNGCGKTVLFKALLGALPYQGRVLWPAGTRIGYVPQKLDIERDLPLSGRDFLRAKAEVSCAIWSCSASNRSPPISSIVSGP